MSLVTKYYPLQLQKLVNAELCKLLFFKSFYNRMLIFLFFKSWEEIILGN